MSRRLRVATFNVENLDDTADAKAPSLATRISVLRPQLLRLDADILCLQEVHGQEAEGQPRQLLALAALVENTPYKSFNVVSTKLADGSQVYDVRNLVILSRFPIVKAHQHKHNIVRPPAYRRVTSTPPDADAEEITWERPILHAEIQLSQARTLHVLNVHLKSKNPASIPGQQINTFTWRSISGWAEGYFLSSMKRVGQALELRQIIDTLFDEDLQAMIVACGDFNADIDDVPMEAIRGDVENTGNAALALRNMIPCERTIPEPARFSLYHRGKGNMLDHLLISRPLLQFYRSSEIHNEILHDESVAFADDQKFPESDHAPVLAEFELPDDL
jgi:endonuclease/exonuclease/phosphatase family metal-dependent hydrolase